MKLLGNFRSAHLSALALLLLAGFCQFQQGESAKILTITFMSSKSHRITYEPLLRELARRGHEITALSPIKAKDEKNFKNIMMIDPEEAWKKGGPNLFEMKLKMPNFVQILMNPYLMLGGMLKNLCLESYQLPQIQEVMKQKWDLVFITPLFNECIYGIVHKLNTTSVIFNPTSVLPWVADNLGTPSPPSFIASAITGFTDRMSLMERTINLVRNFYDWAVLEFYFYPQIERMYRELLNDPTIPGIKEIERNVSIVLANSHVSFAKARPLMQDIIEVGGLHLTPAKPVEPKELNDFLNGGKDGFILFSMGSALKGSEMPENYRKMFLNVFSKLKQRVIWKWETETMDDLPPNVKLSKWLPQQDVLGHKNIRLFITHGGHGSTTEAIYHGVPLVGIPMLADQPTNMIKASKLGFALPPLEFAELTEEILLNALNEALNNPSYYDSAKRLSKIFKDQETNPLERAVYWIEYVLRHQGATHLRSAARDLGYIQYFSIDVLLLLSVVGLIALTVQFLILRALFRKCFGGKKTKVNSSKKNK